MPKSSIIPLKFNAKMDGIGGIVIGNVFKVEQSKLPLGYQGDDIAFTVMSIGHKISDGQEWTTEIGGQLLLLDNPLEAGSTSFTLGGMGMSAEDAANFNWGHESPVINQYDGSITYKPPSGDQDREYYEAQGPEADWWALISILITEVHHHNIGYKNPKPDLFKQDICDVAQSLFNRWQVDTVLQSTMNYGMSTQAQASDRTSHGDTGGVVFYPPYYGVPYVGSTFKSMMIVPKGTWHDADGGAHEGRSFMALAAYAVTYDPGYFGSKNVAGNNRAWSLIEDAGSAMNAIQSYYKAHGGVKDTVVAKRIQLCKEALLDKNMMDNARTLVEGRTDYRGANIPITSNHSLVTPTRGFGNFTKADLRSVKLRNSSTGNKFFYGGGQTTAEYSVPGGPSLPAWDTCTFGGSIYTAAPVPHTLKGKVVD